MATLCSDGPRRLCFEGVVCPFQLQMWTKDTLTLSGVVFERLLTLLSGFTHIAVRLYQVKAGGNS